MQYLGIHVALRFTILDKLARRHIISEKITVNVQTIEILKIDIEGAELELFRALAGWLNRVNSIVIELHDVECKRMFFDALAGYRYDLASSGELTIYKNLRRAE